MQKLDLEQDEEADKRSWWLEVVLVRTCEHLLDTLAGRPDADARYAGETPSVADARDALADALPALHDLAARTWPDWGIYGCVRLHLLTPVSRMQVMLLVHAVRTTRLCMSLQPSGQMCAWSCPHVTAVHSLRRGSMCGSGLRSRCNLYLCWLHISLNGKLQALCQLERRSVAQDCSSKASRLTSPMSCSFEVPDL